jgi:hypothetical protein
MFSNSQNIITVISSSYAVRSTSTSSSPVETDSTLTVISGVYGRIQAPMIPIAWQSTDSVVLNWLQSLNTTKPTSTPPVHHSRLSGGDIAGIVIGAIAGLGLFIGAMLLWLKRRRRLQTEHFNFNDSMKYASSPPPPTSTVASKAELHSKTLSPLQSSLRLSGVGTDIVAPSLPLELPATDKHGFPIVEAVGPAEDAQASVEQIQRPTSASTGATQFYSPSTPLTSPSNSISALQLQQNRLREERDRLRRLQEIDEMDARLEEQLQREREEERRRTMEIL